MALVLPEKSEKSFLPKKFRVGERKLAPYKLSVLKDNELLYTMMKERDITRLRLNRILQSNNMEEIKSIALKVKSQLDFNAQGRPPFYDADTGTINYQMWDNLIEQSNIEHQKYRKKYLASIRSTT